MAKPRKPKKGDLVLVTFVDLAGHPAGDSTQAELPVGQASGWFVGYRTIEGVRTLVCEETRWNKPGYLTGWKTWPASTVKDIKVLGVNDAAR